MQRRAPNVQHTFVVAANFAVLQHLSTRLSTSIDKKSKYSEGAVNSPSANIVLKEKDLIRIVTIFCTQKYCLRFKIIPVYSRRPIELATDVRIEKPRSETLPLVAKGTHFPEPISTFPID